MTMDRKTMKLMTVYEAVHPISDVDRICLPRKNNLTFFVKITAEKTLIAVRRTNMANSEETTDKIVLKRKGGNNI